LLQQLIHFILQSHTAVREEGAIISLHVSVFWGELHLVPAEIRYLRALICPQRLAAADLLAGPLLHSAQDLERGSRPRAYAHGRSRQATSEPSVGYHVNFLLVDVS